MRRFMFLFSSLALSMTLMAGCDDSSWFDVTVCTFNDVETWSKDGPPPLDSDNILGTYTLIDVVYPASFNGKLYPYYSRPLTYSGSMDIQEDTLTMTVTINGETEIIDGPYTRAVSDSTNGYFYVNGPSGVLDISYGLRMWTTGGWGMVSPDECGPPDCTPVIRTALAAQPSCITRPIDPYNDPTFWE